MESLELRIFKQVADEKSISKAAKKMGYVQSNITAHIKKLEEELNTVLLLRHNKGVTLTPEGEKLLQYTNEIVKLLDNTANEFKKKKGILRIGATQTIASSLLPKWISIIRKENYDISISVVTNHQSELGNWLMNAALDCILLNEDLKLPKTETVIELDEELVIITPQDNKRIEDLKNRPIIVNNIDTCPYRKMLTEWLLAETKTYPSIIEFDTLEGIINSVSLGIGISLLPKSTIPSDKPIDQFSIEGINNNTIRMLIQKKILSVELNNFINVIKNDIQCH